MNILDQIVLEKQREVAKLPAREVSSDLLQTMVSALGPRRDFFSALLCPRRGQIALVAEVKKASPSAGLLCADFDPVRIAREYEAAGATCLSVLTDEKFFQGSGAYLGAIRRAVGLPLLRKDFLIDPRQFIESLEWGADAILLIVSILKDCQLREFLRLAESAHLTALVEVHDEEELRRAWDAGARLLGVNNRDLKTFRVDLGTTERVALALRKLEEKEPRGALLVAESGISARSDVERVGKAGARAILVGEHLVKHSNIAERIAGLL